MKGTLHKTNNGWQVSHATHDIILNRWTAGKFPINPYYEKYYFLDEDADGSDVEFEIEDFYEQGMEEVVKVAKLINQKVICEYSGLPAVTSYDTTEYPELEGTNELCHGILWDEIYDEYSKEQYPPFGGPFTNSLSFIDWLKQNYKAPERIEK